MREFLYFWWIVTVRAFQESWEAVIQHSFKEVVRNGVIVAATLTVAFVVGPTLVKDRLMSADNTQDTVAWTLIALAALGALLVAVFVVHFLFITPYRLWREARDAMPPPPRTPRVKEAPPKPLTAHAVERKLRVIDEGLDLLAGVQPLVDQGPMHMRDPFHVGQYGTHHSYPDRVQILITDIHTLAARFDALRSQSGEYPDVVTVLEPTFRPQTVERLAEYMNACRDMENAVRAGASRNDLNYMFSPFVAKFEVGLKGMADWRDTARRDLTMLRNAISAA